MELRTIIEIIYILLFIISMVIIYDFFKRKKKYKNYNYNNYIEILEKEKEVNLDKIRDINQEIDLIDKEISKLKKILKK